MESRGAFARCALQMLEKKAGSRFPTDTCEVFSRCLLIFVHPCVMRDRAGSNFFSFSFYKSLCHLIFGAFLLTFHGVFTSCSPAKIAAAASFSVKEIITIIKRIFLKK